MNENYPRPAASHVADRIDRVRVSVCGPAPSRTGERRKGLPHRNAEAAFDVASCSRDRHRTLLEAWGFVLLETRGPVTGISATRRSLRQNLPGEIRATNPEIYTNLRGPAVRRTAAASRSRR